MRRGPTRRHVAGLHQQFRAGQRPTRVRATSVVNRPDRSPSGRRAGRRRGHTPPECRPPARRGCSAHAVAGEAGCSVGEQANNGTEVGVRGAADGRSTSSREAGTGTVSLPGPPAGAPRSPGRADDAWCTARRSRSGPVHPVHRVIGVLRHRVRLQGRPTSSPLDSWPGRPGGAGRASPSSSAPCRESAGTGRMQRQQLPRIVQTQPRPNDCRAVPQFHRRHRRRRRRGIYPFLGRADQGLEAEGGAAHDAAHHILMCVPGPASPSSSVSALASAALRGRRVGRAAAD